MFLPPTQQPVQVDDGVLTRLVGDEPGVTYAGALLT